MNRTLKNKLIGILLLAVLFLIAFFIVPWFRPAASLPRSTSSPVYISASIPQNSVSLYGYTSPMAKVELENQNIYALTYANDKGYFTFDHTYLPKNTSDLCLTATDTDTRRSPPLCLPAPPPTQYHTNIGPILLPPTLTIDAPDIKPGATTVASGQSIPHSTLNLYLYQQDSRPLTFPKTAQAFLLPHLELTTDSQGNYNFNLPTVYSTIYRLFSTANYLDSISPKSTTLSYSLPSLFYLFWLQYRFLIILSFIFLLTLTFFLWLLLQSKPPSRYLPVPINYFLLKS